MKKKKKLLRNSFFGLLVKNYILFTFINIIIFFIVLSIDELLIRHLMNLPPESLKYQNELLENGDYDEINVEEIVKGNGWIEILDSNYNVIYRKGKVQENVKAYTKKEIEYIGDYYEAPYIINSYKIKDNGKIFTVILKERNTEEKTQEKDAMVEILDDNYNVVYSCGNPGEKNTSYTKREVEYMTGTYFQRYQVKKYDFKDKQGNTRFLIAKIDHQKNDEILRKIDKNSGYMFYLFLIIYIINVSVFIILLNRKVKKPLEKINDAMTSFAEDKRYEKINFKGSREFMQICNSFNVMASKLKKSEEEKESLAEEKQKMLSDISHDLKTPVTIIQGYAKALADGVITDEEQQKKYLNVIYQKSINVTELINLFYEYNKLEHPDFQFKFIEQNLSELLRNYVAERYDYIIDQGFVIEVDIPEKQLICQVDENQMQRAFENIISNSIKYNPSGTIIAIALEEVGNWCKITIADNGVGIPHDIADSIFDAFVVGDKSRTSKQGTGLGLAIAKKIVEKNNGKIRLVLSKNAKYKTQFEILIPKI